MKRITRILFVMTMFFGVLSLGISSTYAYTSPGVTFVEQNGKIYLDFGEGIESGDMLQMLHQIGNGSVDVNLADSGLYGGGGATLYITVGGSIVHTVANLTNFNLWETGQCLFGIEALSGVPYIIEEIDSSLVSIYWILAIPDLSPVISGETAFVTNVDNPLTEATIRSYITAADETDGDITHLITKTSDTYTPNMNTVGTYQIVYHVEDSAGNETSLTVHVLVRDVTAPTWSSTTKNNVSKSYTQTFDIEAYKSQLGAADNYDAAGSLVITIATNTYTASKTIPGVYQVTYKIKDTAGNETLATVNVTVFDDVDPTFTGPTTIAKPSNSVLAASEIKAQLSANDAINGNRTSSILIAQDNFTGHGNVVGSYTIIFSVEDLSGNVAEHTVTINVFDNLPPIFYIKDNYFISVEQSVTLTLPDIIDILEITGQLEMSGTSEVRFTLDEYTGNESTPGIYAISMSYTSSTGNEFIYNIAIDVIGEDDSITIEEPDDPAIYQPAIDFVVGNQDYFIGGVVILLLAVAVVLGVKKVAKDNKKQSKKRH